MKRGELTGIAATVLLAGALAACGGGSSSAARLHENGPIAYLTDGMEVFELNEDGSGRHTLIPDALDFGISPDGSKLAYVANVLDPVIDDYVPRLFESDANGKDRRKLAGELALAAVDSHPDFSPDGKIIVFTAEGGGDTHIYSIHADGSALKQLTTGSDGDPDYSPDGKQIVFARFAPPTNEKSLQPLPFQLYLMNADGSDQHKLRAGSNPAWSPDGTQIAYDGLAAISVMNADGSDAHELIELASEPAWSPDGKRIAYSAGQVGEPANGLYVLTLDDGEKTQLVHTGLGSVHGTAWEQEQGG
jgi:Tol biopolymer transport system component